MKKEISNDYIISTDIYAQIHSLLQQARHNVVSYVNVTMVQTYFEIGRVIVENEQNGSQKAQYGKSILKN